MKVESGLGIVSSHPQSEKPQLLRGFGVCIRRGMQCFGA